MISPNFKFTIMIFLQVIPPNDLFSPGTFATLAGATGIVYVLCGAIQKVFNYNPKWLALLISIIVSFVAFSIVPLDPKVNNWTEYLIAFLNGFLIFMTATGTNQLTAPLSVNQPGTPTPQSFQKVQFRKFNTNWWS